MSPSSSRPWMVPSSPKVPCRTGKIMSTLMARSDARRVRGGSVWKGAREPPDFLGSGGTTTASPAASTAAAGVVSGSPARRWRASCSGVLPFSNFSASAEVSQRPSLVMPIGTTSYLLLSIAPRTDAAERRETSCSPLRPPKRMPTRSFFMTLVWTRVSLASISRYDLSDVQKKKGIRYDRPIYHDEPPRSVSDSWIWRFRIIGYALVARSHRQRERECPRYRLVKIQREVAPAAAPPFEGTRFQRVHTQHRSQSRL